MNGLAGFLLLCAVCMAAVGLTARSAFAVEPDDAATCAISVTVEPMMEWASDTFTAIVLANIDAYAETPEGSETQTIYTNCNFTIGADNIGTEAELSSATDTLVTKYQLVQDGDGTNDTGATGPQETASDIGNWVTYDLFLNTPLPITHVNNDGAVDITLSV